MEKSPSTRGNYRLSLRERQRKTRQRFWAHTLSCWDIFPSFAHSWLQCFMHTYPQPLGEHRKSL